MLVVQESFHKAMISELQITIKENMFTQSNALEYLTKVKYQFMSGQRLGSS